MILSMSRWVHGRCGWIDENRCMPAVEKNGLQLPLWSLCPAIGPKQPGARYGILVGLSHVPVVKVRFYYGAET